MTETERTQKFLARRARKALLTILFVAALLVSMAVNIGVWWQAQQRAEAAQQTAVSLAQQVQDACTSQGSLDIEGRDLCKQADDVVEDPAAPPPPADGRDGEDGTDAPPPTDLQVASAVDAWCSTHDCTLRPTAAQVADALADYCAANHCRGRDGDDGDSGTDAPPPTAEEIAVQVAAYCADGACRGAAGADAPPPTAEQIQAEVVRYCQTRNDCRGSDGANGGDGDDGTDGIGIKSVSCPEPDDDWVVTYTDDRTEIVPGPCRIDPIIPTPEEG